MKAAKASVDFQVLDNGTVKFTASWTDAAGNPPNPPGPPAGAGVPVWSSSDSSILGVLPDASDSTGYTAIGTPAKLGTGVVVTVGVPLADGSSATASGDPVDVVAGPAGKLVVSEQ